MSKTNNINSETHNLQKFDDYKTLFLEKNGKAWNLHKFWKVCSRVLGVTFGGTPWDKLLGLAEPYPITP